MALGMKLKQAREAMGLTEADIAESTHMMIQMIQEIEAEDYHRFSAPIYGKGFIKLYAKAVGLDPAPLVAEFMAAMAAAPEKSAKPPQVALEAIDKHNETGISIVTPEVPEKAEESTSPPAPPPPVPVPRHVYPKASAVTLPNTDSPHPLPEPVRPTHKPAPPPSPPPAATPAPVATPAPSPVPPTGDGFRLEAEPAVSVAPPKPVAAPLRPFQHPVPKQTSHTAPAPARTPTPVQEDDEQDEDAFVARPPRRQAPRRNRQRSSLGLAEACRNWMDKVHEAIAARRKKSEADDDDAPLGDEATGRHRRWIAIGAAVAVVALAVLMLSNGGGDKTGAPFPEDPGTVEGGVEPIVDGVETVSETPVIPTPAPTNPTAPTEIVRVLPPPKCFAR